MRIIGLGDTHGRINWEEIVSKEEFDKVVFIGDYFDTHYDVTPKQQIKNFKEIIKYKEMYPDKVVLLFGNHDYHYLSTNDEEYSGYQHRYAKEISKVLHDALDKELLQMCFVDENYIFTHAGVTKTWCSANSIDLNNLEESINDLFNKKPNQFGFTMGDRWSRTGDDICQTPIWVRPMSLGKDKIDGYTQVIGHTTVHELDVSDKFGIILIDCLGTSGQYLSINDGVAESKL